MIKIIQKIQDELSINDEFLIDTDIVSELSKKAKKVAIDQLSRQTTNRGISLDDCIKRNLRGEVCEYLIFQLLTSIFPNNHIIQNDEEKTNEYWWDLKFEDKFIEVKCIPSNKKWIEWKSFEAVKTLYDNCEKIEFIIFCKEDNFVVKPYGIMIGKYFKEYLKKSNFSGVYLDFHIAIKNKVFFVI